LNQKKKKTYDHVSLSLSLVGSNFGSSGSLSLSLLLVLLELLESVLGDRLTLVTIGRERNEFLVWRNEVLGIYILQVDFLGLLSDIFNSGVLSRC
jgi:hypothetical protein